MGRMSIKELRRRGVPQEDIDQCRELQEQQRRHGVPVLPLVQMLNITDTVKISVPWDFHDHGNPSAKYAARNRNVVNLTAKALRHRGEYDKAALLLDQRALLEKSPERAELAREASKIAKELSSSNQIEFDFFGGGNVSIAFQYQDAVTERLHVAAPSAAKMDEALAVLWQITRHLGWQSYECTKTAADLCEIMRKDKAHMARTLDLLEQVGAIKRVKRGRSKMITVTPEGAFRGNVNNHGAAVERYRLEVIEGGRVDG